MFSIPTLTQYPVGTAPPLLMTAEKRRRAGRTGDWWDRVEPAMKADPVAVQITAELARKKKRLRVLTSEAAWRLFLEIEELELRRTLRWLSLVATRTSRRCRS